MARRWVQGAACGPGQGLAVAVMAVTCICMYAY
jgi:hypothetical protein